MFKGFGVGFFLTILTASLLGSGCATTRNTQGELDALNVKVATLEGQLSEKDAEIARLENRMREEENARLEAENEKRELIDKLEAARAKVVKVTKPAVIDSDLK